MTSPKELTEKIFNDYCLGEFTTEKEALFKREIESLLSSALEEAKIENGKNIRQLVNEACEEARAAALEEAAKIAEWAAHGMQSASSVAMELRKLAEKEKMG